MTPRGLEQGDVKSGNSKGLGKSPESGGAESGAESGVSGDFDADLRKVIDAWADLPEAVKTGILAMVDAAGRGCE